MLLAERIWAMDLYAKTNQKTTLTPGLPLKTILGASRIAILMCDVLICDVTPIITMEDAI